MSLRALIVDDERLARVRLRQLLAAHPEVVVVAEASSAVAAAEVLAQTQVDLVFLDVQMPGGSGLTLFELVDVAARVVFVTAWDQYAVQAFDLGAVDYLLKPVDPDRLALSLSRLDHRPPSAAARSAAIQEGRICLVGARGLQVVPATRVLLVRGAGDYSEVLLEGGLVHLSGRRLYAWEERLCAHGFFRVHRQVLINTARVDRLERRGTTRYVWMNGLDQPVEVARRRLGELEQRLGL